MGKRIDLSPYKDEIIERYEGGEATTSICKDYDVSWATINNRLHEWSVDVRDPTKAKFNVNHDCFSNDSEQSMYFAGLLLADGNVCHPTKYGQMRVGLTSKDVDVLNKFSEFLGCPNKGIYSRGRGIYCFEVRSNKISEDLKKFGVVPNKAKTASVSYKKALINRNFWRGFSDGDASIRIDKNGYPVYALGVASRNIVEQIKVFCIDTVGLKDTVQIHVKEKRAPHHATQYHYSRSGYAAQKLVEFMYENSNVYMDRKYKMAQRIINEY